MGVAPGHPAGQVLGEEQVDAVVDGDDRWDAAEQRPHVVGRVKEVRPQPPQLQGDRNVLSQAIAPGVVDDGDEVLGQVAESGLVGGVTEDEVGRVPVEAREMADQIADVRADPVVPPLSRVDRDLHRAPPCSEDRPPCRFAWASPTRRSSCASTIARRPRSEQRKTERGQGSPSLTPARSRGWKTARPPPERLPRDLLGPDVTDASRAVASTKARPPRARLSPPARRSRPDRLAEGP